MVRRYRLLVMMGWQRLVSAKPAWIVAVDNNTEECLGLRIHADRRKVRLPVVTKPAMMSWAMGTGNQLPWKNTRRCLCTLLMSSLDLNDGFLGETPDIGVAQEVRWTQTTSDPTVSYANNLWALHKKDLGLSSL